MLNNKTSKLKNKKILLVCKERTSFTMYFLGKQLEKNNIVHYFFNHHADVFGKNNFNEGTFFYFKEKINIENIHDVKDIYANFLNNRKNIKINFERLEEIKKKYKGQFLEYRDARIPDIIEGYALQAIFYYETGDAFCDNNKCRLFDAHWQKDLFISQIDNKKMCKKHEETIIKIRNKIS